MSEEPSTQASSQAGRSAAPRTRWKWLLWLLLVASIAWTGYSLWHYWPSLYARLPWVEAPAAAADSISVRLDAIEHVLAAVQREQRQQSRSQSDNAAALGIVREELFGVRDRATLLEEAVEQASLSALRGDQALRLDEAELLLAIGHQRLVLADDIGSAIHAYSLAANTLALLNDPSYISLRQTLDQELAALRALTSDPRDLIRGELDAFQVALSGLPVRRNALASEQSGSRLLRALGQLVQVRPVDDQIALRAEDRGAAETALELQLVLARLALERRDQAGFEQALARTAFWLGRLYTDSPERQMLDLRLAALAELPLRRDLPVLGSTLQQLRLLRRGLPATAPAVEVPVNPPPADAESDAMSPSP